MFHVSDRIQVDERADAGDELHKMLFIGMAKKIASGEFTAAEASVARQLLKDNGIDTVHRPYLQDNTGDLVKSLPEFEEEDIPGDYGKLRQVK